MFWAHLMENTDRMSKRKWNTLLAICDASYCITLFNFGSYGSNSFSGILVNSALDEDWNTIPPNYQIIQRKFKERSNHTKKSEVFKENKRLGACCKNFDISIGRM